MRLQLAIKEMIVARDYLLIDYDALLGFELLDQRVDDPCRHYGAAERASFLAAARQFVAAHQSAVGALAVGRRRLVVRISHHIVGADLAQALKRKNATDPALVIELRIDTSRAMLEAYAAIVLRHDARRGGGDPLCSEDFG